MEFYATVDADSVRPYMPPGAYLVSAASWWRKYGRLRATPLPAGCAPIGGDWGGFVITYRYKLAAAPFTLGELAEWYVAMRCAWGATTDYCCEPEITERRGVRDRQDRTTAAAWDAWQTQRAAPFCWVPTVQGWEVGDYRRHAAELRPLVAEMAAHYGPGGAFRVGVGTLCRRASPLMVRRVVQAVAAELPGVPLHLWGVTHRIFDGQAALSPQVASLDSAAWNGFFGRDHELWRSSGMSKRQYAYLVALPRYRARYEARLSIPRNYEMDLWGDLHGSTGGDDDHARANAAAIGAI